MFRVFVNRHNGICGDVGYFLNNSCRPANGNLIGTAPFTNTYYHSCAILAGEPFPSPVFSSNGQIAEFNRYHRTITVTVAPGF